MYLCVSLTRGRKYLFGRVICRLWCSLRNNILPPSSDIDSHRAWGVQCVNCDWVSENGWMMSYQGRAAWQGWLNVGVRNYTAVREVGLIHATISNTVSLYNKQSGGECVWASLWLAFCACVCMCLIGTEAVGSSLWLSCIQSGSAMLPCIMTNFSREGDMKLVHTVSV